jgi:hypothetical protein
MSWRSYIKLYIEILDDPKMGMMPHWLWRRTIELFMLAGVNGDDGTLQPVSDMAYRLHISIENMSEALQALSKPEVGVVYESSPGQWVVTHFEERQRAATSNERVARYRKRKRAEIISGNGSVTERYSECNDKNKDYEEEEVPPPPVLSESQERGEWGENPRLFPKVLEKEMLDAGVFPSLLPEIASYARTTKELRALLSWCWVDNPKAPAALFIARIRARATAPYQYYGKKCKQCGLYGVHKPDCGGAYTDWDTV